MLSTLVEAMKIPPRLVSSDPYEVPQVKKHLLILGGTHLIAIANLFRSYAVDATIIIPAQLNELDCEMEYKRALQLETIIGSSCKSVGIARDLSGVDSDSVDFLVSSISEPAIRETFVTDVWRVTREFGKVGLFTLAELSPSYLGNHGIAGAVYYPVEGLYVGTMRKRSAIRTRN